MSQTLFFFHNDTSHQYTKRLKFEDDIHPQEVKVLKHLLPFRWSIKNIKNLYPKRSALNGSGWVRICTFTTTTSICWRSPGNGFWEMVEVQVAFFELICEMERLSLPKTRIWGTPRSSDGGMICVTMTQIQGVRQSVVHFHTLYLCTYLYFL